MTPLEQAEEKIKQLCTKFPVRESEEFDDGRESMKREVLQIIKELHGQL